MKIGFVTSKLRKHGEQEEQKEPTLQEMLWALLKRTFTRDFLITLAFVIAILAMGRSRKGSGYGDGGYGY